jgi:RimJ/RimL family protein N-acetyltransferase
VIRLRAICPEDVPLLDAHGDPAFEGEFNDFGVPATAVLLERAVAVGAAAGAEAGMLVVDVDGEPVGTVGWRTVGHGPNVESACYQIGIALAPHARGRGIGSTAQRMLADYLFATSPVNRVEASTDVANLAEQRSLERAGFRREGVLRGAQFRHGAWHDLVAYARLRADG